MSALGSGYSSAMTGFVMGVLIIQLMLGVYLLSHVAKAGMPESDARATQIADPVVFANGGLALAATALWVIHLVSDERAFAWATFAVLLLGGGLGSFMGVKTVLGGERVSTAGGAPADTYVAEKQIPMVAILAHALMGLTLVVCTGLVAFGVVG